jgi:hypothetical protein
VVSSTTGWAKQKNIFENVSGVKDKKKLAYIE